ncbi:alpha-L-fucosidase [Actinokineospora sp. HUAS TT18]|uniref:alpha-L-fucosidase n=1 Tax=Actinokineospora sp. HUAS TT18 TaxID=3447451 RepID=UPI003F51E5CD
MRRHLIVALTGLALAIGGLAVPAAAAPGNNYVSDDALTAPRTQWFRDDRFGMFIHYGVYAAYKGRYGTCRDAEWIKRNCNVPWSDYEAKAAAFNPSAFDAKEIVRIAKQAGQKYIVITSKHHDGFSMWPTAVNDWNIRDRSGFQRDLLAELATEARANGIKFGLYYSIWDWHDPDYATNFPAYQSRMKAQLRELVTRYDPSVLWFDGEWGAPFNAAYGEDLEAYVRGLSSSVVINNRSIARRPVDGDYGTPEQNLAGGPPVAQIEESCMTINGTWGYADWDSNFKSPTELTRNLLNLTSNSANFLLNIGPTETGAVTAGQSNALKGMGDWMAVNSSAIYGAGYPGVVSQPSWGKITRKGNKLYLAVYAWSPKLHVTTTSPVTITGARVLGSAQTVAVQAAGDGYDFTPSGSATNAIATVIEADIAVPGAAAVGTGTGLKAEFWANKIFSGTPAVTRVDPTINYAWRAGGSPASSIPTDNFSSRWTGSIQARRTEKYTFTTASDDTVRVWIDGRLVIDNLTPHAVKVDQGSVVLAAGRRYDIKVEHTEAGGEAYLKLIWAGPNTPAEIVPKSQLYPSAGNTRINNGSVATYAGSWGVSSARGFGDYADDVHYTTSNGASFSYTFSGTGIDYFTETFSDEGQIDIYLDNVFQTTVNATSGPRLTQQAVYRATGLTPGTHTLKGVKKNGTYMLVDRLDVTS